MPGLTTSSAAVHRVVNETQHRLRRAVFVGLIQPCLRDLTSSLPIPPLKGWAILETPFGRKTSNVQSFPSPSRRRERGKTPSIWQLTEGQSPAHMEISKLQPPAPGDYSHARHQKSLTSSARHRITASRPEAGAEGVPLLAVRRASLRGRQDLRNRLGRLEGAPDDTLRGVSCRHCFCRVF